MKVLLVTSFFVLVSVVFGQNCTRFTAPANFVFSTATSAYQVEGGAFTDGKGPSTWDMWTKNRVLSRDSGDVTCDSYHKYKEDVQMLKYLGVKRYRFSIAWSRILPDGTNNQINPAGVQYYNNLINELLANGIEPMATMYHWDLPEALSQKGGWLNRDIVDWFGDYARVLYRLFGDRVNYWMTLNEPIITSTYAYCGRGTVSAPGNFSIVCPWSKYLSAHHQILAHAKAYDIYNKEFRFIQKGKIGIVLASAWYEPASSSPEDVSAAERARAFALEWFANPIFKGDYPEIMKQWVGARSASDGYLNSRLPEFTPLEKFQLRGGLFGQGRSADWLGINYYYSFNVSQRTEFPNLLSNVPLEEYDGNLTRRLVTPYPSGLRKLLNFASQTYKIPVMVTENGLGIAADSLDDQARITYIKNHIVEVLKAIQDGSNIFGYTAWSLMDNLEWSSGFGNRFGLFNVDFNDPTRPRTPKASAAWYKQVVQQRYIDVCV